MAPVNSPVHQRHPIQVEEDVGALRRTVAEMAADLPSLRDGDADLVATELGTNLLRHTDQGGYVLYRALTDGIELLALDGGPGLRAGDVPPDPNRETGRPVPQESPRPSVPRESRDGSRGLGAGLNTVRRRSVDFDWYATSAGTAILARLGASDSTRTASWQWGGVNVPLGGSGVSGDGWAVRVDQRLVALVVDGLGHGEHAAAATQVALTEFQHWSMRDPRSFVGHVHEAMLSTRGGVLGLCVLDQESGELTYVGVGNIHGRVFCGQGSHRLLSRVGVLGTEIPVPDMQVATGEWRPGATLMLATDGIKAHWDQDGEYPALLAHDPALIAAIVERDHSEGNDDAALLVVRDLRNPVHA
ncbi:SpoIIE family protein phosphatase [Actinopolymorpha sp. B9G3]|uniref:SpoIIE family protein phosphatase n=1 Tax=Actinopolymorpha sp. B9G3 TaxID=3158970 RepID=UPI0032D915D9